MMLNSATLRSNSSVSPIIVKSSGEKPPIICVWGLPTASQAMKSCSVIPAARNSCTTG